MVGNRNKNQYILFFSHQKFFVNLGFLFSCICISSSHIKKKMFMPVYFHAILYFFPSSILWILSTKIIHQGIEFVKGKLTRFVVQWIWESFWSISLEDSIKHELYISEEYYLAAWCSAISKIALLFKTFGHIHSIYE